jgi:hypothetical protein
MPDRVVKKNNGGRYGDGEIEEFSAQGPEVQSYQSPSSASARMPGEIDENWR